MPASLLMTATSHRTALFSTLYADCDGVVELRAIRPSRKGAVTAFMRLDEGEAITAFLATHADANVYFGVATRRDGSSGTLDNCAALSVVFADLDFTRTAEPDARRRLDECPFLPTALVQSGHGLHVYWVLNEPLNVQNQADRALAYALLKRIAHFLNADPASAEPAHVLRVPGTVNHKYTPPRPVVLEWLDPYRQYHASEFDELLPPEPVSQTHGTAFVSPERIHDGERNRTLYRLGRSLKAKGLSHAALAAALRAENVEKCEPPIDAKEMEDVISSAWTQPDRASFTPSRRTPEADADEPVAEPEAPAPFTLVTPPESFITRYVAYAQKRTDAPPDVHEALACGILSVLAGPQVTIPIATSPKGWRLVLWLMNILNSTTGRKTTQQNFAKDILVGALGEACLFEWEGSPQGLIQWLQERDGQATAFLRDEYSGLLAQMNRGCHLAGLPQVLIRAFDGNPLENIRTRKKDKDTGALRHDTDRAANPYLVKLCATTWDAFVQRATPDNILDGLLARFTFVTGQAKWQPPRRTSDAMVSARNRLVQEARRIHDRARLLTTLDLDDAVLEAYGHHEQAWLARIGDSACPHVVGPSVKRLAETVLKVAGLLALDLCPTDPPHITLSHFEVAQAIGARWLATTVRVYLRKSL